MRWVFRIAAVVSLILHYLGWAGVILGIIAFVFGNRSRAFELVVGGFGFIVLKYVIGFIVVTAAKVVNRSDANLES